jgi:hypothetical protein
LIETVIANIEEGNHAELVIELKRLRNDFQPTYENRANYDGLINEFVDRMEARESDDDSEVASDSPPS